LEEKDKDKETFNSNSYSKSPNFSIEKSYSKTFRVTNNNYNNNNNNFNSATRKSFNNSFNSNNNFSPIPNFRESNFRQTQKGKSTTFKNSKNENFNNNNNNNSNKLNDLNSTLINYKLINSFKKISEKTSASDKFKMGLTEGKISSGILKANSERKNNENKFSSTNFNFSGDNNTNTNDPSKTFSSNKKVSFGNLITSGKENDFNKDLNTKFDLITSAELSKCLSTTKSGKYSFRTIYKDKNVINKNIHFN